MLKVLELHVVRRDVEELKGTDNLEGREYIAVELTEDGIREALC